MSVPGIGLRFSSYESDWGRVHTLTALVERNAV